MFFPRNTIALVGVLAVSLTLAGCSSSDSSGGMSGMGDSSSTSPSASASPPSSTAASFSEQDVTFLQGMIPHHTQAVEMTNVILAKSDIDPQVTDIAQTIKEAQEPEIELMEGMLEDAGEPSSISMDSGMDGMMSDDEMAALESATGIDASKLFLEQMTEHHTNAVDMAQMQIDSGDNPDVIDLAQMIVDNQQAEITQMQDILNTL